MTPGRSYRPPHRRALKAVGLCLAAALAGCGASNPLAEDLVVTGSVASLDGTLLTGAAVSLVRTQCVGGSCTPTVRGTDTTGSDGRFEIVVERRQDEQDSWSLVCFEFTMSIQAAGHVSLEGHYDVWRTTFCSTGEARDIAFRLEPA